MDTIDFLDPELIADVERAYDATRAEGTPPWRQLAEAEQERCALFGARMAVAALRRLANERNPDQGPAITFEAIHASLVLRQPVPGVVLIEVSGYDVGEFADAPFQELERMLIHERAFHLFIDARKVQGASIDVTGEWAKWLGKRREQVKTFDILVTTPFLRITADFVSRFAALQDRTRVFTHAEAFDLAMATRIALATP